MIKIENFDLLKPSGISYGGHDNRKKGIIIDNERWFLKYPKTSKNVKNHNLTSTLSEYIGSHIYELLGVDVQETKLGIANGKIVVACKDFLDNNETILDYNMLQNEYDENIEKATKDLNYNINSNYSLEKILLIMDKNHYFKSIPKLKERFWDMFIIDYFISNNDRKEDDWGLILNKNTNKLRLSPVYDNGASFHNNQNDNVFFSIYELDGKRLNLLNYIENLNNKECNKAILRIIPKINMEKIADIFNELPEEYNGLQILSKIQKAYFLEFLKYKYNNVLIPIYNKLLELDNKVSI